MISNWIPMDQYQDIMCCAVKRCRDDKGFVEIHKQLERSREHLIRNVEDFKLVAEKVETAMAKRRKELKEHEQAEDYGPQRWRMGNDGAYIIIGGMR